MKRILAKGALLALVTVSGTAFAGHHAYYGPGPVHVRHVGAAIVGAAVGALVGSSLTQGEDGGGAVIGGAVVGAVLGSALAHDGHHFPRYAPPPRWQSREYFGEPGYGRHRMRRHGPG